MSDTPILTQIKTGLEIIFSSVTEIKQVCNCPIDPVDLDTASFPLLAFEDRPQSWTSRDRLEVNTTLIYIETWYGSEIDREEFITYGDFLEATLHKAIISGTKKDGLLNGLINKIVKNPFRYDFTQEKSGILVQNYTIDYLVKYGDSFTKNDY